MIRSLGQNRLILIILFILSFALYASNISGVSVYILDEAKNAECAREMFQRHDLIVPTFNDILRTDKPPLHYFFMMIAYSLFGVSAFSARLFSALFGALTLLISYRFVKKFSNSATALLTALILLASVHLSIQFHLSVPDPYLIFFFTASLIYFYRTIQNPIPKNWLLMYLCIGLGTLAKGPVAIGLPGLIFLAFLVFSRRLKWSQLKKLRPFTGALIVLVIALPWYILAHYKTQGAFTEGFFMKNNINRFAGEMEGHGGSPLRTLLFVLVGMFPFSVFIVQATRNSWKHRKNDFVLFNLISVICIIVFFAISGTKLPNYTVPAYPFIAILLALYLQSVRKNEAFPKVSMTVYLILALLLLPGILIAFQMDPGLKSAANSAWFFLPLPILACISYYYWRKKRFDHSFITMSLSGFFTAIIFFCLVFPKIDQQTPVNKSLAFLQGKRIVYYEHLNAAFPFNLKQVVKPIERNQFESFFEENPQGVIITEQRKLKSVELPDTIQAVKIGRDTFGKYITVLLVKKGTILPDQLKN